jgi:hypothetical protein
MHHPSSGREVTFFYPKTARAYAVETVCTVSLYPSTRLLFQYIQTGHDHFLNLSIPHTYSDVEATAVGTASLRFRRTNKHIITISGGLGQTSDHILIEFFHVLFFYVLAVHGLATCDKSQVNISRGGKMARLFGRETGNRTNAWVVRCATCGTFIAAVLTRHVTQKTVN